MLKHFGIAISSEIENLTKKRHTFFVSGQIKSSVNVAQTTFNKKLNPTDHTVYETHGQ